MKISKLTDSVDICREAKDWLTNYNDLETAYNDCKNPRWLLFVLDVCRMTGDDIYNLAKELGYSDYNAQHQPLVEDIVACNTIREKYPWNEALQALEERINVYG